MGKQIFRFIVDEPKKHPQHLETGYLLSGWQETITVQIWCQHLSERFPSQVCRLHLVASPRLQKGAEQICYKIVGAVARDAPKLSIPSHNFKLLCTLTCHPSYPTVSLYRLFHFLSPNSFLAWIFSLNPRQSRRSQR